MTPADAADWLRAWDSQGYHRTGTDGDEAGAAWLAREAAAQGAQVSSETFALERVDPVVACLELDGVRIDAVPVFDAPATGPDGIIGTLGPAGSDAAIGVAELSPQAAYSGEYRTLRRDTLHRALVIICQGSHPGMGMLNAEQFREPYGAPAIHVASEAREVVLAAASRGNMARVVAASRRTPASARNVVVTIPGRDAGRAPVVVMTPRSSWWQSTSERGGGLVCWLATMRALLAAPSACDVVMTANSGHELGHLGLDDFITRRAGWDRPIEQGGTVWVHYGANLGAVGGSLSVVSNCDELRAQTAATLAEADQPPDVLAPKTLVPSGETRDIHRAGGRYVTLVGSNPLFHLPQDRWPHAVDVPAVARIALASARLVVALTQ
jgi:hypothetical protein